MKGEGAEKKKEGVGWVLETHRVLLLGASLHLAKQLVPLLHDQRAFVRVGRNSVVRLQTEREKRSSSSPLHNVQRGLEVPTLG